jgi:hypothetical protein
LSWLSDIGHGLGVLDFGWGVACVAIWSLLVLAMALRTALPAQDTARMMSLIDATA